MTKEDLAKQLDGCEYGEEMSNPVRDAAKASGLVVVFGASDDLTEFSGAINDEAGLGKILLNRKGVVDGHEDCPCDHCGVRANASRLAWVETDFEQCGFEIRAASMPFARFSVMEDGQRYGDGIVFSLADLGLRA